MGRSPRILCSVSFEGDSKGKHSMFPLRYTAKIFAVVFISPKAQHRILKHQKWFALTRRTRRNRGLLDLGPGVPYNVPMAWDIGRTMLCLLAARPLLKVCVLGNSALNANAHAAAGRRSRGDLAALHTNDNPRPLISTRGCVAELSLGIPVSPFLSQEDGDQRS